MDPASALSEIASHGILGAICVILIIATWRLYLHSQTVQNARVEDAQKMAEMSLNHQKDYMTTISAMTAVIASLKESVDRLEARRP
jgi:hypothetical protein